MLPAAPPPPPPAPSGNPDTRVRPPRPEAPDAEHVLIRSVTQEVDGVMRHMRGMVHIETNDMLLTADELDYNSESGDVSARGHVHFEHYARGEKMDCDRAEYNVETETGKFYEVSGTSAVRVNSRPGLLTTKNPFYFQGKWAERLKDRYILYDGFLTDCLLPRPWWRFKSPKFDVVPGERAIVRNGWFYVRGMPLVYTPYFYKSLRKEPRRSGFLLPTVGRSSVRGTVYNFGYYWAINRSYDINYRGRYFTQAGLDNHIDYRGYINQKTSFDGYVDGIKDTRGVTPDASGAAVVLHAKSQLGHGWEARGELNHLTSFAYRQFFTESFQEAVYSQTHSVGYVTKHWNDAGLYFVSQRNVQFQSTAPGDQISIRRFPEVNFIQREHQMQLAKHLPFWFSMDSTAGLLRRSQPAFQTRAFVDRFDFAPRVTTAVRLKQLEFIPSFGFRATGYGSSVDSKGTFTGQDVWRNSRDFSVDMVLPSLSRIFGAPRLLGFHEGDKLKHVIEPRVTYKYVTGIDNFAQLIRFDETDILTNTNQVEFSVVNRLYSKDKAGTVRDYLTWSLRYVRYMDPTFGGAITPGKRNVVDAALDLTGYAFLDGYRHSSPVVSALRLQSRVGLEWRSDYDPIDQRFVNQSLSVDSRIRWFFLSMGHSALKTNPVLAPSANQFRGTIGIGDSNRKGWSAGFSTYYDYRTGYLQYAQTQAVYNTDCCGVSVQYRRLNFGPGSALPARDEFRASFAISNIGSFGTLKRQERVF